MIDEKDLPLQPDGIIDFYNNLVGDENILIYKRFYNKNPKLYPVGECVEIKCTACGSTFLEDKVKTGHSFGFTNTPYNITVHDMEHTICPICNNYAKAVHISHFSSKSSDTYQMYPMSSYFLYSVHEIKGALAILMWGVTKLYKKNGTPHYNIMPYEACAYTDKERARFKGWYKDMGGREHYYGRWFAMKNFKINFHSIEKRFVMPFDASILDRCLLKNTKLDVYINAEHNSFPCAYLRLFQSYPALENLVTHGASYIINEKISDAVDTSYNWYGYYETKFKLNSSGLKMKIPSPSKALGISKPEFDFFIEHKVPGFIIDIYARNKPKTTLADVMKLHFLFNTRYRCLSVEAEAKEHNLFLPRLVRYLEKQEKNVRGDKSNLIDTYKDYLDMLIKIGDTITPENAYPKNLKTAHDTASDKLTLIKSQIAKEKFTNRYNALSKFIFENELFIIFPCESELDLKHEGKELHHCVYSYANKYVEGKSAIFFIRKKDAPKSSYYTLELDEKSLTVKQNRGNHNCARTPEIQAFEDEWLEHIKKINLEEIKKNGKQLNNSRESTTVSA